MQDLNARFFELPEARRAAMIDAGLHIFAETDYKRASMDAAAARAGVSKSLLFHYFENKKGYYLFLLDYGSRFVIEQMSAVHNYAETDFFRILVDAQMAKIAILHRHPDIMRFIARAYLEENPAVRDEQDQRFKAIVTDSSARFLARVDDSKLRPGVSAAQLLNLVLWMSEGYMRSRTPEQLADLEALNADFLAHMELLRRQFYREECL